MSTTNKILQMAENNNGIVTSAMVKNEKLLQGNLKYLYDTGKLEKVARGVYLLPNVIEDEFFSLQSQFKRGIFSLETALFLWGLTDQTPNNYCMTFPLGYNLTNVKKKNIKGFQTIKKLYALGLTETTTPCGNIVHTYDMERTLCDILRPKNNVDIQIITEAFKNYVQRRDKNIPKLSENAKILKVEYKLRAYLEVLL